MITSEKDIVFLIADIAGYTALTEAHGGSAASEIVDKFINIINASLREGVELKERVGDEVLLVANNANSMADTAVHICELAKSTENFPCIHIGLHRGKVIEKEGRFYGSALNLTSRISNFSKDFQICCSSSFVESIQPTSNYIFNSLGAVRFKNYSLPIELYELVYQKTSLVSILDPVCKMQLITENAPVKLIIDHSTYYFCSTQCANKFSESPENYLQN